MPTTISLFRVLRRSALFSVLIALVATFAGCSSGSQSASVHGLLLWPASSQGFYTSAPRPTAGTVDFVHGSQVVDSIQVGKTGIFSMSVPAGTYVVKGLSGRIGVCGSARPVHLAAARSVSIEVDCRYQAGKLPK